MTEVEPGSAAGLAEAMAEEGDLVAPRLARGCRAFAVCLEDRVAAYGWVSTRPEWIGEVRLELRPGDGEAYLWNCVTLEEHRRRGIFRTLIGQVASRLQAEGLRRLWIAEAGGPAVPALPAAGYRPVILLEARGWGPLRRVRAVPALEADPEAVVAARQALSLSTPSLGLTPPARRH